MRAGNPGTILSLQIKKIVVIIIKKGADVIRQYGVVPYIKKKKINEKRCFC